MGFETHAVLMQDNKYHREARRLMHVVCSAAQVKHYHAMFERETCSMLIRIFDKPECLSDHIRVYVDFSLLRHYLLPHF